MRVIKRVSEEYIYDPESGLYYWLAPIYKRGAEQDLLDDMEDRAYDLSHMNQAGDHVFRPTAMIQLCAFYSISEKVKDRLSENTYLMLFNSGAPCPDVIGGYTEWIQEGTNIFEWSDDNTIYTWCNPDQLGHRFYRVSEEVALEHAFSDVPQSGDIVTPIVLPIVPQVVSQPKTTHITGKFNIWTGKFDITKVEE